MNDDPILQENINKILPTLPAPIQRFLQTKQLEAVTAKLMDRYSLHIDQAAILEQEIFFLLVGFENPDEVMNALNEELPVSEAVVQDIMKDLNTEVFIPLRDEMVTGAPVSQTPASTRPPTRPVTSAPPTRVSMPAPSYAPPPPPQTPQPSAWVNEPSSMIQANPALPVRPSQAASTMLRRTPPRPIAPAPKPLPRPTPPQAQRPAQMPISPQSVKAPAPTINIVINTAKMLEDHEEPSITFKPSTARVIPPPPNLPGAMPPPLPKLVTPPPPPRPVATVPPPAPRPPNSPDPYREPVDGE